MKHSLVLWLVVACVLSVANADFYFHMQRGSNNRLDEANRDRDNANRLFDSQNNNRGGYNVGNVYYYQGSTAQFEWTNQHSCNDPRSNCEIIFQFMCDAKLRDGTQTTTIPNRPAQCVDGDCDSDIRFGRHESASYYNMNCKWRQRNKGLFISVQNLASNGAISTRQNNAGTRFGYECPEERDYYPYWAATPWRDIAVFTNQDKRCDAYKAESQNVKSRFMCQVSNDFVTKNTAKNTDGFIPITKEACTTAAVNGSWVEVPAWGISAPACQKSIWSRDNHNGFTVGTKVNGAETVDFANFQWSVPTNMESENCVLRGRYNISTGDFSGSDWASDTSIQAGSLDYRKNKNTTDGNTARTPANIDIWSKYKLSASDVADSFNNKKNDPNNAANRRNTREYVNKDNPNVDFFGSLLAINTDFSRIGSMKFQLAINTAQYGRTFEDRSHRFAIRKRPDAIPSSAKIVNLQVRGKRGNIVQVYPGVEYDFVPNLLEVKNGDYLHIQWTGSNSNPNNNAGQGREGTDRSNIIAIRDRVYTEAGQDQVKGVSYGQFGSNYPAKLNNNTFKFLGLSNLNLEHLALLDNVQYGGQMEELDDAGTYYDLGPVQMTQNGIYHYMSTRNNNFSNRSQKGRIRVSTDAIGSKSFGISGGKLTVTDTAKSESVAVSVEPGVMTSPSLISVQSLNTDEVVGLPHSSASSYVMVTANNLDTYSTTNEASGDFTLEIPYSSSNFKFYTLQRASCASCDDWEDVDASVSGGTATYTTNQGGVYAVSSEDNTGAIIGIVVGSVVGAALIGFGIFFYIYKKKKNAAAKDAAPAATTTASAATAAAAQPYEQRL